MGMISIKELSVEAETSVLNENGEFWQYHHSRRISQEKL
jgi:hypothetical protein